jgi:hypothetical protein
MTLMFPLILLAETIPSFTDSIALVCHGVAWRTWESMRIPARALLDANDDDKLIPFVIYGQYQDHGLYLR